MCLGQFSKWENQYLVYHLPVLICCYIFWLQSLFESVVTACKNGGRKVPITTQLGYTKEQVDTIQRLKNGKTDYEKMGLYHGANKYVFSIHVL